MREVLIVFPKLSFYESKKDSILLQYRAKFIEWIKYFDSYNCVLKFFIEDELATEFVGYSGIKNIKPLTVTCRQDYKYIEKAQLDSVSAYFINHYNDAIPVYGNIEKEIKVPNFAKYGVNKKEEFRIDREKVITKRARKVMDLYISKSQDTLFYLASFSNFCLDISDRLELGDSKLYILEDLSNSVSKITYSGIGIDKNILDTLMSVGG